MASFQAKNFGKGQEREKMKIIVSFRSFQTRYRKFQKNSKKKIIIPLWHHFKPKQFGKGKEREKIKIIVSFGPYLTRNLKFQKNCKKIQKIKKCWYGFI